MGKEPWTAFFSCEKDERRVRLFRFVHLFTCMTSQYGLIAGAADKSKTAMSLPFHIGFLRDIVLGLEIYMPPFL